MTKTRGTKEWSDSNVNCYYGCSNNCRYCYARYMAFRFKRIDYDDWKTMIPNKKAINKGYRKRKGRIMFPTSHDITTDTFNICWKVLEKLLKANNEVLITTKPDLECMKKLLPLLKPYKSLVQFRFTITSISNNILAFFEPNAPSFEERFESLQLAFNKGFKTSVSIEPYLDIYPNELIRRIAPYCTESIWIGLMSNLHKVTARGLWEIQQIPHDPTEFNEDVDYIRRYIRYINEHYRDYEIEQVMKDMKKFPEDIKSKIRLKDSIVNKLQLRSNRIDQ